MSKKGIIQNMLVIVLGLAIICMSVGYALSDVNKASNESPTFEIANWDVHLENPLKTSNSTIADSQVIIAPNVNADGNELDFILNLNPGDVYEFSFDVKNAGTFDAKLSNYSLSAKQNGVDIVLSNKDGVYENNNIRCEVIDVSKDESLNEGTLSTKKIKVTALMQEVSEEVETPEVKVQSYEFKFNMNYVQK